MELSDYEINKLIEAGKIAKKVLKNASKIVKPGTPIIEICNELENMIIKLGGKPAFPCNVSVNEIAAHYSSPIGDESIIPENSLVKIDIGVHVDGFIADTAKTFIFNSEYIDLVEAAEKALENAISAIKPGVEIRRVSSIIEQTIKRYGYKPIKNLSGHLMKQYLLHGGKSVPNVVENYNEEFLEGEVYAIEPFSTNGAGMVEDTDQVYIYGFIKIRGAENKFEKSLLKTIRTRFRNLPFSERWLTDVFPPNKVKNAIHKLAEKGALHSYPVLKELANGMVAQAEHTIIVLRDGALITTN